jgi:hypothetical protein
MQRVQPSCQSAALGWKGPHVSAIADGGIVVPRGRVSANIAALRKRMSTLPPAAPVTSTGVFQRASATECAEFLPQLAINRTGKFFEATESLSAAQIESILDSTAQHVSPLPLQYLAVVAYGGRYFQQVKEPVPNVARTSGRTISGALSIRVQPIVRPAAIAPGSKSQELTYAHALVLEIEVSRTGLAKPQRYVFVQHAQLADPMACGLDAHVVQLSRQDLLNSFLRPGRTAGPSAKIQALSMRMMTIGADQMLRKVVEANNIESATSSLGLHRAIPGSMRLSVPVAGTARSRMVSISPRRSSVRTGSARVNLDGLTRWVAECAEQMDVCRGQRTLASNFLGQMAQEVPSMLGLVASGVLLDRWALEEYVAEHALAWSPVPGVASPWSNFEELLDAWDDPIVLKPATKPGVAPSTTPAAIPDRFEGTLGSGTQATNFLITLNKTSCAFDAVSHGAFGRFSPNTHPGSGPIESFEKLVSRIAAFRVGLDSGKVLYCADGVFQSGNLDLAVDQLIKILRSVPALGAVTSEKGDKDMMAKTDTVFQSTSSFSIIESSTELTAGNSTVICEDGSREWCDYLEIGNDATPRHRWLHAKVQAKIVSNVKRPMSEGKGSLSASKLQEVVGQATKNLAFIRAPSTDQRLKIKVATWANKTCDLPKKASINRLRRGPLTSEAAILTAFDQASGHPGAVHEIAIVVPNYSHRSLTTALRKLPQGTASQSTIQLFWLLSSFMHACLEVGATPIVFTR